MTFWRDSWGRLRGGGDELREKGCGALDGCGGRPCRKNQVAEQESFGVGETIFSC